MISTNLLAGAGPACRRSVSAQVVSISFAASEYSGVAANGTFAYRAGAGSNPQTKTITFHVMDQWGGISPDHTATIRIT